MSETIRMAGAIITLVKVDFDCPKCKTRHFEQDYYDKMHKSKNGLIYRSCKNCKDKLGITTNMMGDVVVWLKSEERQD